MSLQTSTPATIEASPEGWIGEMIDDRHRLVRHIASGGMGHVFLAEHVTLGGLVAIKMLLEPTSSAALRSFFEEACIVAHLQHPNIVGVSDFGSIAGHAHYLVMELIDGTDLREHVEQQGAMPPWRALWILRQLASAVDYMHARGVVHRDIKPDNILLQSNANDAIKLVDFGVAYEPALPGAPSSAGVLIGTPLYMAPEQTFGEPANTASDNYSVAALALELLTGEPPYAHGPWTEVVQAVRNGPPRLPSAHGLSAPGLDEVMAKALHREPSNRYASAKELVDQLAHAFARAPHVVNSPRPRALSAGRARRQVQAFQVSRSGVVVSATEPCQLPTARARPRAAAAD